jgi:hypothetical protein
MSPKEITTEINLPSLVFIETVRKKIANKERDKWDSVFSFSPHLELENVSISNDKLIIEKSMKPLDKFSRYRGISGTIESEILNNGETTLLKTEIHLHTAVADFIQYFIGVGLGLSGLTWLILDFDIRVLAGLLIFGLIMFGLPKLFQRVAVDDLVYYYNQMIEELIRK